MIRSLAFSVLKKEAAVPIRERGVWLELSVVVLELGVEQKGHAQGTEGELHVDEHFQGKSRETGGGPGRHEKVGGQNSWFSVE